MIKLNVSVYDYNNKKLAILKSGQNSNIEGEIFNPILLEDANGQFEFNFVLPLYVTIEGFQEENWRWAFIVSEYKIKVEYDDSIYWFKIKSTNDEHDSGGSLKSNVQCKATSYELNKKNTELIADKTDTAENLIAYVLNNTGWAVGTVDNFDNKTLSLKQSSTSNALNLLNEIATLFDGRLVFDTNNNTVSFYSNDNLNDSGIDFRVGKNIKSLTRVSTSDDIVTRLYVNGGEIDSGTVGIQSVNPTKEPYIDNFTYYIENGMMDTVRQSKITQYNTDMKNYNTLLEDNNGTISNIQNSINSTTTLLNVATYERNSKQERIDEINTILPIESNGSKIVTYINEKNSLASDILSLNNSISNFNTALSGYNSQLTTAQADYDSVFQLKQTAKNTFYSDMADFIHEGLYDNSNLIKPQSIYDDGVKVLADLCMPKVSYNINILDLSVLTGYELEKFKLHDVINIHDSFLKVSTKVRITKIERNLDNLQDSTIEIANFYTALEEILRDITRNAQIIKSQQKYWDRTPKIVNPDGTLDIAKLQATFDMGTFKQVSGTNNSINSNESGILLQNIYDSTKMVLIDGDTIKSSSDGGSTWTPIISSKGSNVQNVFGGVMDISQVYLRGNTNFYWNGDGLFAINPNNMNHWIRFNQDGFVFTIDNGANYELSMTWAGLQVGKHSVTGLQADLDSLNSAVSDAQSSATVANENLNDFISEIYSTDIDNLQSQIDGNITTWFYSHEPTLYNLPASDWVTTEERNLHLGNVFYDNNTGYAYRFLKEGTIYKWQKITDSDITKALEDASRAQDTADNKRRVFITQPNTPYDAGDLWRVAGATDLKVCVTPRASGNFISSDWVNATDVQTWVNTQIDEVEDSVSTLQTQLTDFSSDLKLTKDEAKTLSLSLAQVKKESLDLISVANSLSITTQKTNYSNALIDLETILNPFLSASGYPINITVANRNSIQTAFENVQDRKSKLINQITTIRQTNAQQYASDEIDYFVSSVYAPNQQDLQTQIDGKIMSYITNIDPNKWTAADRDKHNGDMWYNVQTKELKQYHSYSNTWILIQDKKAIDAYDNASRAQDTADGKRRVFTATPYPPYDVGDLWSQGTSGDLMRCKTQRLTGSYRAADWEKASKYTDDTVADEALDKANSSVQKDVFYNRTKITETNGIQVFDNQSTPVDRLKIGQLSSSNYGYQTKYPTGQISHTTLDDGTMRSFDKNGNIVFDSGGLNSLQLAGFGIIEGFTLDVSNISYDTNYIISKTVTANSTHVINNTHRVYIDPTNIVLMERVVIDFLRCNSSVYYNVANIGSNYVDIDLLVDEFPKTSDLFKTGDVIYFYNKGGRAGSTGTLKISSGDLTRPDGSYYKMASDYSVAGLDFKASTEDYDGFEVLVIWVSSTNQIRYAKVGTEGTVRLAYNKQYSLDRTAPFPNPRTQTIGAYPPDPNAIILGAYLCGWGLGLNPPYKIYDRNYRDRRPLSSELGYGDYNQSILSSSNVKNRVYTWNPSFFENQYKTLSLEIGTGIHFAIVGIQTSNADSLKDYSPSDNKLGAVLYIPRRDSSNFGSFALTPTSYIAEYYGDSVSLRGGYLVSNTDLGLQYTYIQRAWLELGYDKKTYLKIVFYATAYELPKRMRLNISGW